MITTHVNNRGSINSNRMRKPQMATPSWTWTRVWAKPWSAAYWSKRNCRTFLRSTDWTNSSYSSLHRFPTHSPLLIEWSLPSTHSPFYLSCPGHFGGAASPSDSAWSARCHRAQTARSDALSPQRVDCRRMEVVSEPKGQCVCNDALHFQQYAHSRLHLDGAYIVDHLWWMPPRRRQRRIPVDHAVSLSTLSTPSKTAYIRNVRPLNQGLLSSLSLVVSIWMDTLCTVPQHAM